MTRVRTDLHWHVIMGTGPNPLAVARYSNDDRLEAMHNFLSIAQQIHPSLMDQVSGYFGGGADFESTFASHVDDGTIAPILVGVGSPLVVVFVSCESDPCGLISTLN